MNELALFAGAGGGILGGHLLGWRTVCAVEWQPYGIGILCQRQNDGILFPFPVWDDIRTFDGRPWRGVVDVVSGGFPCQDISNAGKGAGITGERSGLWREMARIIGEVRPRFVLVENSPTLTIRGLGTVLGDLAALGYDCRWTCLRASDCGAPHQRDRWWLLADSGRGRFSKPQKWEIQQPRRSEVVSAGEVVADACAIHAQREQSKSLDSEGWPRQNARQTGSCRNGVEWWSIEPDVGRVAHGVASRVGKLKALGNGQVPLQAAVAWKILTS